jgi:hypothetical protein
VTLRAEIQTTLRGVIDMLGETWQYRRMTCGNTHLRILA